MTTMQSSDGLALRIENKPGRTHDAAGTWREPVRSRLAELVRLPVGWDGYTGVPVKAENARFAMDLLSVTCPDAMPAPEIVPGPGGDLQVEWHNETVDIELHVRGPNDVSAWRAREGKEEELRLTDDFAVVSLWLRHFASAEGEIAAAAE